MSRHRSWIILGILLCGGCSGPATPQERRAKFQKDYLGRVENRIQENPKDADAWRVKGRLLSDAEQYEKALQCFDRAVSLDRSNDLAWVGKITCLKILGRKAEAEKAVQEVWKIDANPGNSKFWTFKAQMLHQAGEGEAALKLVDEALVLDPHSPSSCFLKSSILMEMGKKTEAVEWFRKGYATESNRPWVYKTYIYLLLRCGQPQEALKVTEDRIAELGKIPLLIYLKGAALVQLGQNVEGRELMQSALKEDPGLTRTTAKK